MRLAPTSLAALILFTTWQGLRAEPQGGTTGRGDVEFDVVIAELRPPFRDLIVPTRPVAHKQFPIVGGLDDPQETANYLDYLELLQRRDRLEIITRLKITARSGERTDFLFTDLRSPLLRHSFGSVGVQFGDEFRTGVRLFPILYVNPIFPYGDQLHLDVETLVANREGRFVESHDFSAAELGRGQSLLLVTEEKYPLAIAGQTMQSPHHGRIVYLIMPCNASDAPSSRWLRKACRSLEWELVEFGADVRMHWEDIRSFVRP